MKTNHEEVDIIIVHHLVGIASGASDDSYIKVVFDDGDVFLQPIHFYLEKKITTNVSMESPCAGRTLIDIRQTTTSTSPNNTHDAHALIGCHSVSYLVGIGKATDLKLYMGGHHLTELVQQGADEII